jgi:hypothetical protein
MQLSQTFVQSEPWINGWQSLCTDGQADRLILTVEGFQPRHAALTDLALPVVENSVPRILSRFPLGLLGSVLDWVPAHGWKYYG